MNVRGNIGQYLSNYLPETGLGKLIGNSEELPEATEVRNYRKGSGGMWGDVYLWGTKIGYLKPGGNKGLFVREAPNPADPTQAGGTPAPSGGSPAVSYAPPPVVGSNAQSLIAPAPPPVVIPTVNTGGGALPTYGSGLTQYVEGAGTSAPITNDATAAATDSGTTPGKIIGVVALLAGGYFLAKALGFKSRL